MCWIQHVSNKIKGDNWPICTSLYHPLLLNNICNITSQIYSDCLALIVSQSMPIRPNWLSRVSEWMAGVELRHLHSLEFVSLLSHSTARESLPTWDVWDGFTKYTVQRDDDFCLKVAKHFILWTIRHSKFRCGLPFGQMEIYLQWEKVFLNARCSFKWCSYKR